MPCSRPGRVYSNLNDQKPIPSSDSLLAREFSDISETIVNGEQGRRPALGTARADHNLTAGDNTKMIHDDPIEERHRWPVQSESEAENEVASTWP